MKKVIRLAAIAAIAMGLTTACDHKKNVEVEDTTDTQVAVVEETIDSVVEEAVIDEPVAEPTKPAAKVEKKEEPKAVPSAKKTNLSEETAATPTTTKTGVKKIEKAVTPTKIDEKTAAANQGAKTKQLTKKN